MLLTSPGPVGCPPLGVLFFFLGILLRCCDLSDGRGKWMVEFRPIIGILYLNPPRGWCRAAYRWMLRYDAQPERFNVLPFIIHFFRLSPRQRDLWNGVRSSTQCLLVKRECRLLSGRVADPWATRLVEFHWSIGSDFPCRNEFSALGAAWGSGGEGLGEPRYIGQVLSTISER